MVTSANIEALIGGFVELDNVHFETYWYKCLVLGSWGRPAPGKGPSRETRHRRLARITASRVLCRIRLRRTVPPRSAPLAKRAIHVQVA